MCVESESKLQVLSYSLGWLPECRGATAMHFIQGGSSEYLRWSMFARRTVTDLTNRCWPNPGWILRQVRRRDFYTPTQSEVMLRRFHEHVDSLNVSATDLYNALLADAELQPPNWDLQGRQANIWKLLGTNHHDAISTPPDWHNIPRRLHP